MENKKEIVEVSQIDLQKKCRLSNKIIEAKYKMRPNEQNLFWLIISQINSEAETLPNYITLRVNDIAKTFNLGNKRYTEIYKLTVGLQSKPILLENNNGGWESHVLFPSIIYRPKSNNDVIKVFFNKIKSEDNEIDIEKELLRVRKAYEDEKIYNLITFKHKYAARFYMLIKQYKNTKDRRRIIRIKEIVEWFCLSKTYEDKITNLRDRVIKPALKEVKERGLISFDYEYLKERRKYYAIRIYNIAIKNEESIISEEQKEAPAALPAPDPKPEELSPEKKKYADKLYSDIGIKPYSKCERLARDRSVGALKVTCRIWKESQESYNPLHAGFAWSMLTPDENGIIQAEEEAKEEEERNEALRKRYGAQESAPKKEKTEEEQIADAGEMNTFSANLLLKALEKGNIDEDFNVLSEDGSTQSIQAGLRSVKKFGYTWDDIRAIKRGDKV